MSLLGWRERVFDPEVHAEYAVLEPASTPSCEMLWFGDLWDAEQALVERDRGCFSTDRNRQLDVMKFHHLVAK